MKKIFLIYLLSALTVFAQDDGVTIQTRDYAKRKILPDPFKDPCPNTVRTLIQVKDNLYRHTNGEGPTVHSGLVLITKVGALVIDPAQTCTAIWLRDEIKKRFKVKVKYVINTHGHFDHIGGSQVFQKDGAIVVAQINALEAIVGEKLPTAVPNIVFEKKLVITLGGETIELHHVAPSHSNSMTMVLFPKYKALQCTDVCESKTMPYNDFLDFYYDGWISTLNWVLEQDVDFIDVGHYTPSNKEDQRKLRDYMVDLHGQILNLVRDGKSWDELYRLVTFNDEVKSWFAFSTMKTLNIMGMYRWVTNHRRGVW